MVMLSFIGMPLLNLWYLCRENLSNELLFFVTAELKMDVLREREVKDNLERQLLDEQKMRGKKLIFACSSVIFKSVYNLYRIVNALKMRITLGK